MYFDVLEQFNSTFFKRFLSFFQLMTTSTFLVYSQLRNTRFLGTKYMEITFQLLFINEKIVCYYFIYLVNICSKHFFTEAAARELLNQLSHNFDKKHYGIRNSDLGFTP